MGELRISAGTIAQDGADLPESSPANAGEVPAPPPSSPLLKSSEAAAYLNVSERTLWTLTKAGAIAHVAISERAIRYTRADLDAWIDTRRRFGPAVAKRGTIRPEH